MTSFVAPLRGFLAAVGRALNITCRFIDFVIARRHRSQFHQTGFATIPTEFQSFVEKQLWVHRQIRHSPEKFGT
jgi:hypothetical protein